MLTAYRKASFLHQPSGDFDMKRKPALRPSVAFAACAALFAGSVMAQTTAPAPEPAAPAAPAAAPAPAPEPDWTSPRNIGFFSQYVFRGVPKTNEKPAVRGGFDPGHKGGFYVGRGASNIGWISDFGPRGAPPVSASLEWDFY